MKMKKIYMKTTLVIATLSIMLLSGLNSVLAMKTSVQNDNEDTVGTKEITIYVYIDENENNKFDDGESLATSAYVQVQRCDIIYVNTIPGCAGWIDRETGSITINVPKTLWPVGDYRIIASQNKIYFSLNQYKGRLEYISTGDMKDGAEFWVGMQWHERKSKELPKSPTEHEFYYFTGRLKVEDGRGQAVKLAAIPFFNIGLILTEMTAGTITVTTLKDGTVTFYPSEEQTYDVYANIIFGYTSWVVTVCQQDTFSAGGLCANLKIVEN
jgi:hypothetical protein